MKTYTPYISLVLCMTVTLLSVEPGFAAKSKEAGVMTPMKYEGGSLALNRHDALKTWVGKDEVVLVQGKHRFVIPVKNITEVSYGSDVYRRVGTAVGVAMMTLGFGALMLLVKTKKHYVGIIWADKTAAMETARSADITEASRLTGIGTVNRGGVVFKVGKGEYRGFMAAIEGVAGISGQCGCRRQRRHFEAINVSVMRRKAGVLYLTAGFLAPWRHRNLDLMCPS